MRTSVIVAVLSIAVAASAGPEDRAAAREHYAKGTKAFDLGRYDEAIAEYVAAYELIDDPALLYNLAQAHRLAGHPRDALRFFRVYLSKVPNADNRADVESKIAELQKTVELEQKSQHELPPDSALKPATTTPPPVAAPAVLTAPAPTAAIDRRPARKLEIAGLATAGGGLALLGVAAAMTALSYQSAHDIANTPYDKGVIDGKVSTFHTYQDLEGVFFAAGGAALAAGVVTYAIGRHRAHSARIALVPLGVRAGGGLSACGAW
ncbi:MAG TPA: hypothetical protein VGL86_10820 [Polyangia bacterium]|jgi:tetratricopeptide (TPR) repeat protein